VGTYNIEIEATGGHGCQREVKDGQKVFGCQRMGCPDCETRRFVKTLRDSGSSVSVAKLTHWPGQESEVQDDLLTGIRRGEF